VAGDVPQTGECGTEVAPCGRMCGELDGRPPVVDARMRARNACERALTSSSAAGVAAGHVSGTHPAGTPPLMEVGEACGEARREEDVRGRAVLRGEVRSVSVAAVAGRTGALVAPAVERSGGEGRGDDCGRLLLALLGTTVMLRGVCDPDADDGVEDPF
jgi:hypothetical protein